jgi:hypothetical protein
MQTLIAWRPRLFARVTACAQYPGQSPTCLTPPDFAQDSHQEPDDATQ